MDLHDFTPEFAALTGLATDAMHPRALFAAGKPIFCPDAAEQAIEQFALHGAAITEGVLYDASGDELRFADLNPDAGGLEAEWDCARYANESWDAFVRRSARAGREALRARLQAARAVAFDRVFAVELAWVTADEPTLFDFPGYLRARLERILAGDPDGAVVDSEKFDYRRVKRAGGVTGSFFCRGADRLMDLPRDARVLHLFGTPKDVALLPTSRSWNTSRWTRPRPRHWLPSPGFPRSGA